MSAHLFFAQAMRELDVGSIPVCDGVRLVGIVTDRDIVIRGVAQERVDVPLSEVMSDGILYCHGRRGVVARAPASEALLGVGAPVHVHHFHAELHHHALRARRALPQHLGNAIGQFLLDLGRAA